MRKGLSIKIVFPETVTFCRKINIIQTLLNRMEKFNFR